MYNADSHELTEVEETSIAASMLQCDYMEMGKLLVVQWQCLMFGTKCGLYTNVLWKSTPNILANFNYKIDFVKNAIKKQVAFQAKTMELEISWKKKDCPKDC